MSCQDSEWLVPSGLKLEAFQPMMKMEKVVDRGSRTMSIHVHSKMKNARIFQGKISF